MSDQVRPEYALVAPARTPGPERPTTPLERAAANVAALENLRLLEQEEREATERSRSAGAQVGVEALSAVFDPDAALYARFESVRQNLQRLLSHEQLAAAKRRTFNAYYADRAYVRAIRGCGEPWRSPEGDDGGQDTEIVRRAASVMRFHAETHRASPRRRGADGADRSRDRNRR